MPTLTLTSGVTLHFIAYGEERLKARAPIVFLNGMTQTTLSWKTLARRLQADSAWPVITYDARGQGESEVGQQAMDLRLHVEDLVEVLDELGVAQVHAVGFSHGARVAMGLAAWYPDRVQRLVLTSATASPSALADTIVQGWREILRLGGVEAMSWASIPAILGPAYLEQHRALVPGMVRASVQRNKPEGVAMLLDGMKRFEPLAELAELVQAPTCVVSGEHDVLVGASGARELARLCRGEWVEIPDVGHTVPIEAPRAFMDAVLGFLEG